MIIDVPSQADFLKSGSDFLNLGWDATTQLALEIEDASSEEFGLDVTEETRQAYWQAAQTTLGTAVALVQQGAELLIKGRIAAVSPYLLIAGAPRDWPRDSHQADIPFSQFKTIDSQELIRAHDATVSPRLTDEYKTQYELLRGLRNTILHSVIGDLHLNVHDVVLAILETSHHLIGQATWLSVRREFIARQPGPAAFGDEYLHCGLARELDAVLPLLLSAQTYRFFGYRKSQRRYLCPSCLAECSDYGFESKLAWLSPNQPTSATIHCIVCDRQLSVTRDPCSQGDCLGNVIASPQQVCLTCGRNQ